MMGVMHGDRVRVSVERGRDGRYSGRLEKILEHATKAFVGTLEVHGRTAFVTAADRRVGMRCLVAPADLNGAQHGDWVIAAVTRYGGQGSNAQARVTRRLDPEKPVGLLLFGGEGSPVMESIVRKLDASALASRMQLIAVCGDERLLVRRKRGVCRVVRLNYIRRIRGGDFLVCGVNGQAKRGKPDKGQRRIIIGIFNRIGNCFPLKGVFNQILNASSKRGDVVGRREIRRIPIRLNGPYDKLFYFANYRV